MASNNLYFWDKLGLDGKRYLLGEVQLDSGGFNMSFVLDGTKDSAKMTVWSFEYSETIKPQTVVWHQRTGTYWIVSNDRVEKRLNESGWLYIHEIQLEGVIELLNARDLTDCGFNQNTYTVSSFINRLFSLSTFEISVSFNYLDNLDQTKIIDYTKTFENYTLLSALREFLDGYNCSAKMRLYQNPIYSGFPITNAFVSIISKSGNTSREPKNIDDVFNDVKEIKALNKNSYGTTVISNAENIISTKKKLYPSVGSARISGENYLIQPSDAVLRLPSKVNSVDYVDVLKGKIPVTIAYNKTDFYGTYSEDTILGEKSFDITNLDGFNAVIDWIRTTLTNDNRSRQWILDNTDDDFWNSAKGQSSLDTLSSNFSFRFYDITQYDPISNKFISQYPINEFTRSPAGNKPFVLGEKHIREGVSEPQEVMYWERGSNLIKGFDFFSYHGISNQIVSSTKAGIPFLHFDSTYVANTYHFTVMFGDYVLDGDYAGYLRSASTKLDLLTTYYKVKYTPLGNVKIKYDNTNDGKDIKLYNQNGRFTDGVALSKLLISYKDEIVSENITRYCVGYTYDTMPQVGDIIIKDNDRYVINNVSLDFYEHEDVDDDIYFVVGEFTLSKNVATKSLLTNPNTNIRDYGIPQNFNVERKQLYRDFYELDFQLNDDIDNQRYLGLDKVFNTKYWYEEYVGHNAVMKLVYDNAYGGGGLDYDGNVVPPSNTWYYQLDSTVYFMKKSMYEIVDFQDNNIIGYDCQNVTCGFDIKRIFNVIQVGTANIDQINTPISYVDDVGKVKEINIAMCSNEQIMSIYDEYIAEQEQILGTTYNQTLYNRCVFIPEDIYNKANNYCDFHINETSYNKDALEIPIFEYSCQIDDSNNVIIGENIFENYEEDLRYIYEVIFVESGKIDNNNYNIFLEYKDIQYNDFTFTLDDTNESYRKVLGIIVGNPTIDFYGYDKIDIKKNENSFVRTNNVNLKNMVDSIAQEQQFDGKLDMVVVRYTIKKDFTQYNGIVTNVKKDLLLIVKNAQNCPYQAYLGYLRLYENHYKLK